MSLLEQAKDQRIIAEEAERRYIRETLQLLKLRMQIIMQRSKAMPNSLQTKGAVTRKAPKKLMMRNKGPGKAKNEKTRATKKNVKRP